MLRTAHDSHTLKNKPCRVVFIGLAGRQLRYRTLLTKKTNSELLDDRFPVFYDQRRKGFGIDGIRISFRFIVVFFNPLAK